MPAAELSVFRTWSRYLLRGPDGLGQVASPACDAGDPGGDLAEHQDRPRPDTNPMVDFLLWKQSLDPPRFAHYHPRLAPALHQDPDGDDCRPTTVPQRADDDRFERAHVDHARRRPRRVRPHRRRTLVPPAVPEPGTLPAGRRHDRPGLVRRRLRVAGELDGVTGPSRRCPRPAFAAYGKLDRRRSAGEPSPTGRVRDHRDARTPRAGRDGSDQAAGRRAGIEEGDDGRPRARYYITTAIDYPNSRPHIGTAFEKIGADVQARFRRMEGDAVHFLMGNDENTIKVPAARRGAGARAQAVRRRHGPAVPGGLARARHLLRRLHPDQRGTPPRRLPQVHPDGLRRGRHLQGSLHRACTAPAARRSRPRRKSRRRRRLPEPSQHAARPGSRRRTTSSASRPSATGCWRTTRRIPDFIQPESRRNEIVSLVETELKDVTITRKGFTWGIQVPFDPEQTIYVWFDALLNYITGIGYGTDEARFRRLWPADVHVIGKDITRFHCALWPAMLMSAGLPLPRKVFGHGFVYRKNEETGEVQKLSKSLGNVVEPMDLIAKFSAEAFRYYFMSQCPFGGDGEFSFERFADVYNADLANNLGNLYSRILTMCVKYFDGRPRRRATPVDPTAWRRGLDLGALVGELCARMIGSFEYNVGPAADLAGGRRRGEPLHPGDRAVQAGQDRPRRPAAPCWSTWPSGCGSPRS